MKKTYTFILLIFIATTSLVGQTTCLDTILYPHSKMTSFGEFQLLEEGTGGRKGISQTFDANTGLVHGINAFVLLDTNGVVGDASSLDVYIKVTDVDALNRPTTTIDSALVTIIDVGDQAQTLYFTSPVAVSGRYSVVVGLNPATSIANSDSLYYRTNNPDVVPADGEGDGLFAIDFAFGLSWTNLFLQFAGQDDVDALLAPVFEKTLEATYTVDLDTICEGGDVVFTNTGSAEDTLSMYNRWSSLSSDPWGWNYADGAGAYAHFDTTYTFATAGVYGVELMVTNYGYTGNCVDTVVNQVVVNSTQAPTFDQLGPYCLTSSPDTFPTTSTNGISGMWNTSISTTAVGTINYVFSPQGSCGPDGNMDVVVIDTAIVADFGHTDNGGGTVQFADSSLFATTYSWDFGDGSPLNTAQNPSHTYALEGTYYPCLTVTNDCNSSTHCDTVNYITLGISDFDAKDYVSVYPVPANKFFNVSVPVNYAYANVVVTDLIGQELLNVLIDGREKVRLSTHELSSGVYFVSIDNGGERVFTKRIVIDK